MKINLIITQRMQAIFRPYVDLFSSKQVDDFLTIKVSSIERPRPEVKSIVIKSNYRMVTLNKGVLMKPSDNDFLITLYERQGMDVNGSWVEKGKINFHRNIDFGMRYILVYLTDRRNFTQTPAQAELPY